METTDQTEMEEATEIVTNTQLDNSVIFHLIKNVAAFVLYMHQQIPSILQDINLEFDTLQTEYSQLEAALTQTQMNASSRRKHIGRMREAKLGIRRLDKLMSTINGLESSLKLILSEVPSVQRVILVLGSSPMRPQHVYELCFVNEKTVLKGAGDFTKSRAAEGLSRKAIRTFVSKGAGSDSNPGPTKLFVLVKAPSSFNMPQHFLPKRDFRYSKKIVPFRLLLKCTSQKPEVDAPDCTSQTSSSNSERDSVSNDLIWFQCRHVVKGLAFKTPTEE